MNLVNPQDRVLLAGLAVAMIVVFARPIRYLLDLARDVEESSGLALVPALIILTVVFFFHQQGKRLEAKTQATAAEADAVQAQARAAEMERLVTFGQALGRSLDVDAIRDVVLHHMPKLAGSDDAWVLTRSDGHWQTLVAPIPEGPRDVAQSRESIANRILNPGGGEAAGPVSVEGHLCVPMTAGGQVVGVLGVPENGEPFREGRRRVLTAAATLLGVSLRNAQLFREVRETSLRDGLTGCFNRTHALEVIDAELRRARRSQTPLSLIMFDLDHFKEVNDRYGHLCGDAALVAVGSKMRDVLRGSDVKCRYGGEEFLVLLPETPIDGAKRVADTLRRELSELPIPWKGETIGLTASFGVTTALPSETDPQALISRADAALYRAKDQGRNCVRLSVEPAMA
ncbi:MAG: sensor domain-containing diguanylate cyclase, partial [Acidobacteria bacterium]|nr:sensor domain-containing diguanylate cyclase [Acidobacteriota bacterium]